MQSIHSNHLFLNQRGLAGVNWRRPPHTLGSHHGFCLWKGCIHCAHKGSACPNTAMRLHKKLCVAIYYSGEVRQCPKKSCHDALPLLTCECWLSLLIVRLSFRKSYINLSISYYSTMNSQGIVNVSILRWRLMSSYSCWCLHVFAMNGYLLISVPKVENMTVVPVIFYS